MKDVTFKDGTRGLQPFDRLVEFDDRSLGYPLSMDDRKPESVFYECSKYLDQGSEGACPGFGWAHALISEEQFALGLDAKYARERIYWAAQRIDPWPGGAYPDASPFYEGSSNLAAAKIVKDLGWIESFHVVRRMYKVRVGYQESGAVFGIPMYEGMMHPNSDGFISAIGSRVGGHCVYSPELNEEEEFVRLHQSWGTSHGIMGDVKLPFEDLEKCLYNGGEAIFFKRRQ